MAIIGAGSVGAGWASLYLARGLDVVAYDPSPGAELRAIKFIEDAWDALLELGLAQSHKPPFNRIRFVGGAAEAIASCDVIQESAPERLDLKNRLLAELDGLAEPHKIIMSSTGGIPASQLQAACVHQNRVVVVHPFNPSHLIPLVEVIGGRNTEEAVIEWAMGFARHIGKRPIRLTAEASGHMTNRLQFALVREAVSCLLEGVASASDIDQAVRFGLAPRWALMGSLLTLHLAGGDAGMRGILDHAGEAIEQWWTPRTSPQLTPAVRDRLVAAAREVAVGRDVSEWIEWRDSALVDVLKLQAALPMLQSGETA